MTSPRGRAWWAGAPRGLVVGVGAAAVLAVAGIVALIALQSSPPPVVLASPTPSAVAAPIPSLAPSPISSPAPTVAPPPIVGADGRFTMLLLGSDYRPANPGNRTDAIMIVSVSPVDGAVSAVSIPRDMTRFPLPDGSTYALKVNELYEATAVRLGRDAAGPEMRRIVGAALGVEIDAYAVVGMYGLVQLIDQIGGVDVRVERTVHDPLYWVDAQTRGVTFPAGINHLDGARALIFARTRQGDSDYARARRQQQVVAATVAKVLERGVTRLPALIEFATTYVRTDLRLEQTAEIFALVATADLAEARSEVFAPPTYARRIPNTSSNELRMPAVRALVADWFAPVPSSSLPASPAPGPTTSPPPASG